MYINRHKRSERGVALLLTLGFASLLSVIIIGFLTTSIIEEKVASNTSNRTTAQMIADCVMNRMFSAANTYVEEMSMNYNSEVLSENNPAAVKMSLDPGMYRFDNFVSRVNEFNYIPFNAGKNSETVTEYADARALQLASLSAYNPWDLDEGVNFLYFKEDASKWDSVGDKDYVTGSGDLDVDANGFMVGFSPRYAKGRNRMAYLGLADTMVQKVDSNRMYLTAGQTLSSSSSSLTSSTSSLARVVYEYPFAKTSESGNNATRSAHGEFVLDGNAAYDWRYLQPQWCYLYKPVSLPMRVDSGSSIKWAMLSWPAIAGRYWYAVVPDAGRIHKSAIFGGYTITEQLPRLGISTQELPLTDLNDDIWTRNGQKQVFNGTQLSKISAAYNEKFAGVIASSADEKDAIAADVESYAPEVVVKDVAKSIYDATPNYNYYLYNLLDFSPRSREEANEKFYVRSLKNSKGDLLLTGDDRPKRFNLACPGVIINKNSWTVSANNNNHANRKSSLYPNPWDTVIHLNSDSRLNPTDDNPWNEYRYTNNCLTRTGGASGDILKELRFLNYIGTQDEGAYSGIDIKTRRLQIAANLIDYCDGNNIPTSDSDTWYNTAPKFTGNERSPYINELAISCYANGTLTQRTNQTSGGSKLYSYSIDYTYDIAFSAELANFFNTSDLPDGTYYLFLDVTGKLAITGSFSHTVNLALKVNSAGTNMSKNQTIVKAGNKPFLMLTFTKSNGYMLPTAPTKISITQTEDTSWSTSAAFNMTAKLQSLCVTRMILARSSELNSTTQLDYVETLPTAGDMQLLTLSGSTATRPEMIVGYEVNDPRCNLYAENWTMTQTSNQQTNYPTFSSSQNTPTLGKQNKIVKTKYLNFDDENHPSEYCDYYYPQNCVYSNSAWSKIAKPSNGTDPITAHEYAIKNQPMASPAELSYIHRGIPWQTLRLDRADGDYNQPNNFWREDPTNQSGTTFSDGDGGILNFVYIGDPNSREELININTRSYNIWRMLFLNVAYSDVYNAWRYTLHASNDERYSLGSTSISGSTLGSSTVNNLVETISDTITDNRLFFQCRSDILRPMNKIVGCVPYSGYDAGLTFLESVLADSNCNVSTPKQRGMLAGRILTLTEADRYLRRFNLVVVAQSINDAGGAGVTGDVRNTVRISKHDRSAFGNLTEDESIWVATYPCRLGEFDVVQNRITGGTNISYKSKMPDNAGLIYFDEIASEYKMLARIKCTEGPDGYPVFTVISTQPIGKF